MNPWVLAALSSMAAAAFWWRARTLRLFIESIRAYAQDVKEGRRETPLPSPWGVGRASLALQAMVLSLSGALQEEEEGRKQLSEALGGIGEGVLLLDLNGRLIFANSALEELLGVPRGSLASRFYWESFADPAAGAALKQALEGREASCEIKSVAAAEGGLAFSAAPWRHLGQIAGAVAILHDGRKQARLDGMRRDLVANVSHELRTPLAAVKASLETLQDGALDDPKVNRSFLDKAVSQAERLQEIVSGLLQLAALEEESRLARVDVQAVASLGRAWEEAGAALEASLRRYPGRILPLAQGVPDRLRCDPNALRQVLLNLMENALKYAGPNAVVEPGVAKRGNFVEVSVMDRGPGIPEAHRDRVFERFYRVDKARARESGGSGLGLAIVKHLVENHGGSLGVENREGGGCRFWFKIPAA